MADGKDKEPWFNHSMRLLSDFSAKTDFLTWHGKVEICVGDPTRGSWFWPFLSTHPTREFISSTSSTFSPIILSASWSSILFSGLHSFLLCLDI